MYDSKRVYTRVNVRIRLIVIVLFFSLQINTVILIMTVFSIVRGKKIGGAETEVKRRQLVT